MGFYNEAIAYDMWDCLKKAVKCDAETNRQANSHRDCLIKVGLKNVGVI